MDLLTVRMLKRPDCDFCKEELDKNLGEWYSGKVGYHVDAAEFDAKTHQGPWAYMCRKHHGEYGIKLGLGFGQRILVESEGIECDCAYVPGDSSHELHCSTRENQEESE